MRLRGNGLLARNALVEGLGRDLTLWVKSGGRSGFLSRPFLLEHLIDDRLASVEDLHPSILGAPVLGIVRGRGPELRVALDVNPSLKMLLEN